MPAAERLPGTGEGAQRALRVAAILFFLSLVVFAKFHEPTRFVHTLQKLAHPVTFGAVALLFLTLLRRQAPRRFGSYAVAFLLTVLCGAGTEVAQAFVHRDPSLLDVLRDALGASTALAGFATLVPGADARGRGEWRVLGALLAIVGFAIMVAPISISLAAYARRDFSFPTLLETCSPLDLYFVSGGGADVSVVPSTGPTTSRCGSALRVTFGSAQYAGIDLEEPYPDWRNARTRWSSTCAIPATSTCRSQCACMTVRTITSSGIASTANSACAPTSASRSPFRSPRSSTPRPAG